MKIFYLHQYYNPPNETSFGNDRSAHFAKIWSEKENVDIEVVTSQAHFDSNFPNKRTQLNYNKVKVVVLPVSYSHYMGFGARIFSFIKFAWLSYFYLFSRMSKNDILYASSTPFSIGVVALMLKKTIGIRYFFETVDIWPDVPIKMGIIRNKLIIKLLYWLEMKIYSHSEHIIALSEGMKNEIVNKGIPSQKITVNHNGTNTYFLKPNFDKIEAKNKINFPTDYFLLLYAGTIGRANGCEAIIDVAKILDKKQDLKYKIYLIGNGNQRQGIENMSKKEGLKNIVFINSIPKKELLPYLQAADLGLITFAPYKILETNSANKFFDYLACGLPVCCNYEGWQKEYLNFISPLQNAKFDDTNEFANHVVKLLELEESQRKQIGEKSRILAEKYFERDILAIQVFNLIQKTANVS